MISLSYKLACPRSQFWVILSLKLLKLLSLSTRTYLLPNQYVCTSMSA